MAELASFVDLDLSLLLDLSSFVFLLTSAGLELKSGFFPPDSVGAASLSFFAFVLKSVSSVSYTHLTLPTNREV